MNFLRVNKETQRKKIPSPHGMSPNIYSFFFNKFSSIFIQFFYILNYANFSRKSTWITISLTKYSNKDVLLFQNFFTFSNTHKKQWNLWSLLYLRLQRWKIHFKNALKKQRSQSEYSENLSENPTSIINC